MEREVTGGKMMSVKINDDKGKSEKSEEDSDEKKREEIEKTRNDIY